MLELYRNALRIRRTEPMLGEGPMSWLPSADGVLTFDRGGGACCVANMSDVPIGLPAHNAVILASGPVSSNLLPPDTSIWLRT